jgi:hypothetical protein
MLVPQVECLVECLVEWVAWVEWVEWECNPPLFKKEIQRPSF